MKTTILILVVLLLVACGKKEGLTSIDKIYPIIDRVEGVDNIGYRSIRVYVIDSCEYIGHINVYSSDFLTHKGNCKFCENRAKMREKN